MRRALAAALVALAACGCGGTKRAKVHLPADVVPVPAGRGARYQLPAISSRVARRAAIDGLTCSARPRSVYGVFVELLVQRRVLVIPAGVGIAPPHRVSGAYVLGGRCSYPIRTYAPTGVAVVDAGIPTPTLGQLFALWGQPLSRTELADFRGSVRAFVGGRRWRGRPEAIPLRRHAAIVLEVGGEIPPHRSYDFPPGL